MNLQELLGNAYKEDMTLAEIDEALADRELLDRSEVDEMVNNRTAATKRLLDTANKKLAEATKKHTDVGAKNASLLERISALEAEAKENKRAAAIAKDTATYVAMGYPEDLAKSTAEALANGDNAQITANMGAFIAQKTQSIREDLLLNTQLPAAGGNNTNPGIDFAKAKADALAAGDDAAYMRLCREEMEQATHK